MTPKRRNHRLSSTAEWALVAGITLATLALILIVGAAATPDWRLW